MTYTGLISSYLRPDHPDFLDLPWHQPLGQWQSERLEDLEVEPSRHSVVFVNYEGQLYALKELPPELAAKEYELLRRMNEVRLPAVEPVGYIQAKQSEQDVSVLITRYLEHSLPYRSLFLWPDLAKYRQHLLDAMANLLVQLHLAGVWWGDCSLNNALFKRDAGKLQAYLVDAETSEIQPSLSEGMRHYELDIMEENISGSLADLAALGVLPADYPIFETGSYIRERYLALWNEINRVEILPLDERFRIQERVRALNKLGFSVDEVELKMTSDGESLKMRAFVTDRHFHSNLLHGLVGLEVEEEQARKMVNEIQELKATLSKNKNRSTPISVAAARWLRETYCPLTQKLKDAIPNQSDVTELYCELLEHKWYLSEAQRQDVGHQKALEDYLKNRQASG